MLYRGPLLSLLGDLPTAKPGRSNSMTNIEAAENADSILIRSILPFHFEEDLQIKKPNCNRTALISIQSETRQTHFATSFERYLAAVTSRVPHGGITFPVSYLPISHTYRALAYNDLAA